LLETKLYDSGMNGNSSDAQFILRHKRYDRPENRTQSSFITNITLEEHTKRLERLGLPVPVIESDYEEDEPKQITQQATTERDRGGDR
jgi:hypothetical protein